MSFSRKKDTSELGILFKSQYYYCFHIIENSIRTPIRKCATIEEIQSLNDLELMIYNYVIKNSNKVKKIRNSRFCINFFFALDFL